MTTKQDEWTEAVKLLAKRSGASIEICERALADMRPAGTQTTRAAMVQTFAEYAGVTKELAAIVLSDVSDRLPVKPATPDSGLSEAAKRSILESIRREFGGPVKTVELREAKGDG